MSARDRASSHAHALPTRQTALTGVKFNSRLAVDNATSSEDDKHHDSELTVDQAGSVIGVSIGREQTRLTLPSTPAVDKAAAIDRAGGFFQSDLAEDGTEALVNDEPSDSICTLEGAYTKEDQARHGNENAILLARDTHRTLVQNNDTKEAKRTTATRRLLKEGLSIGRRRSSSGPGANTFAWQRITKQNHSSSATDTSNVRQPSSHDSLRGSADNDDDADKAAQRIHNGHLAAHEAPLAPIRTHSSRMKRSASDGSLHPYRTLSNVSSLGDDGRFEDIHEQVNSRLKAIKDSWHDSSIKLPHFGSISSLSSLAPDFIRERSLSFSRRGGGRQSTESLGSSEKPVDPFTRQPYTSAKTAVNDAAADKLSSHPQFNRALQQLDGDVVILGGYRGSILRSAEPPHRQVWVPVKVGLNLRKVNLEVGLSEDDDARAKETIFADGMLTHIGPVDISRRLFKRLRHCSNAREGRLRVRDYGYDWRLHPSYLSSQLIRYLEGLPCNRPDVEASERGAIVIAHSLGGLITRHAVNQRPELFRGVVYAGVPQTCVNILGPLRNGDEVLLSSRVLTAQVNFTIRTSFALLPLDGRCFVDKDTREEYPVDFFDPATWMEHRLSPCIARPLPPLVPPSTKSTGISGYMSSMANALSVPHIKNPMSRSSSPGKISQKTTVDGVAEPDMRASDAHTTRDPVVRGNVTATTDSSHRDQNPTRGPSPDATSSPRTTVTISPADALEYLTRTLSTVKRFKEDLAFRPAHASSNLYPPLALIYGKSIPTVVGARVRGRHAIAHADAYDDLVFGSGDGVVLARAAMLPPGYRAVHAGIVSSERGHVTLLGDLEAVGKCLNAIMQGRREGVGTGATMRRAVAE